MILINPVSGKGEAARLLQKVVLPRFQARGVRATVVRTEYEGHALEIARTASLLSLDGIVVMGGDGTVHEVINGMLQRIDEQTVPVGNLPCGSGNSMLMDFNAVSAISTELIAAVDVVLDGYAPSMDVAYVQYGPDPDLHTVYSVNTLGYSADQCLSAINIDGWRGWFGAMRYDICALWGVLKGRSASLRVTADGELVTQCASSVFARSSRVCRPHFGHSRSVLLRFARVACGLN
jgi:sphingosine kinase